jgi:RNA polymerase sigma-70 factor (ECF subfamily)
MVWGVCRRVLVVDHDAEDAFQISFLVLARKASSIKPERLAGWLHGVARKAALYVKRTDIRRMKRIKVVAEMPETEAKEPAPDLWSDERPLLDEELARLPAKYREVICLCYLEEKTQKEAAHQLGLKQA